MCLITQNLFFFYRSSLLFFLLLFLLHESVRFFFFLSYIGCHFRRNVDNLQTRKHQNVVTKKTVLYNICVENTIYLFAITHDIIKYRRDDSVISVIVIESVHMAHSHTGNLMPVLYGVCSRDKWFINCQIMNHNLKLSMPTHCTTPKLMWRAMMRENDVIFKFRNDLYRTLSFRCGQCYDKDENQWASTAWTVLLFSTECKY